MIMLAVCLRVLNMNSKYLPLRISHIGVHTVYCETSALLSSTRLLIYDKEIRDHVKVIISYKSAMDPNILLFESKNISESIPPGLRCLYVRTSISILFIILKVF